MKKAITMLVLLTAVLWLGTAFAGDTKEYHNFMGLPIRDLSPEQLHASLEEQDLLFSLPYNDKCINVCGYPFCLGIEGMEKVTCIQLNNINRWVKVDDFQEASQALIAQFVDMDELLTAKYGTPARHYVNDSQNSQLWTMDTLTTALDKKGGYIAYSIWANVTLRLWLDSENIKHFSWDEPWDGLRTQLALFYNYR